MIELQIRLLGSNFIQKPTDELSLGKKTSELPPLCGAMQAEPYRRFLQKIDSESVSESEKKRSRWMILT